MGPLSDCYVLATDRSARCALAFVARFVPDAVPRWDPIDPAEVIGAPPDLSPGQLAKYLEEHSSLSYSMYFRNTSGKSPYYAILAYCEDGSLILGLSGDEEESSAIELLEQLEAHSGSAGYWSLEEAPANSRDAFLTRKAVGA
jgi:hypothetical protein